MAGSRTVPVLIHSWSTRVAVPKASLEAFYLKILKVFILVVMTLLLLATVGALGFAGYLYQQSPKTPTPAQKAPDKAVDIQKFLETLGPKAPEAEKPSEAPKAPEAPAKPQPKKYKEQVDKIVSCFKQSNEKSGGRADLNWEGFTDEYQRQFQRIADDPKKSRGQPYMDDAARVMCELLLHAKVIEFRKAQPQEDLFAGTANFHLQAWDAIQEDKAEFEKAEADRVNDERNAEQARVAAAKAQALVSLIVAGSAFGMFLVLALYLVISAVESHLRHMAASIAQATRISSGASTSAPDATSPM